MRLPPNVVRRRQGLYLRLRLPLDLARATGRSHYVRTLATADPAEARLLAAVATTAAHRSWERERLAASGKFMDVPIVEIGREDLKRYGNEPERAGEALDAMSPEDNAALARRLKALLDDAERDVAEKRRHLDLMTLVVDVHDDARNAGLIEGLKQAIARGAPASPAMHHPDARVPWTDLLETFFKSRPGLSASTRGSYEQAFAEWRSVIGDKNCSEIEPRDVARYGEWLESKANIRGKTGLLNRKTLVRLTGHVRTFTAWTKASGLVGTDPGVDYEVRRATKLERLADDEGSKRAFTQAELSTFFSSPLFVGCYSHHYRNRPGPNVIKDAGWWMFVTAHLTGGRVEELAQAPATLVDLDGVACLDLRHGSKTFAAPRLVPVIADLSALGFLEMAERQRAAGLKLFEGEGASADWSKWCNRYIDRILGDMPEVSLHSFRHAFRQSCSAAQLGDYLSDKLLGHRSKKDRSEGASYGRLLSPQEARLVVEKLRSPISLSALQGS